MTKDSNKCKKLLEKASNHPKGLRFAELKQLCECAGMYLDRTNGSHHIYRIDNPFFMLSIQPKKDGKAKDYQVKQLLDFIL